jgi:hypothetical protein
MKRKRVGFLVRKVFRKYGWRYIPGFIFLAHLLVMYRRSSAGAGEVFDLV